VWLEAFSCIFFVNKKRKGGRCIRGAWAGGGRLAKISVFKGIKYLKRVGTLQEGGEKT
jgi:hypothetical protein